MKFFKSKEEKLSAKAKKVEEDRLKEEEAIRIIREEKEKQLREIPLKVVDLKLRKKRVLKSISEDNKSILFIHTLTLASMYAYAIVYLLTSVDFTTSLSLTEYSLCACALFLSVLLFVLDNEIVENPTLKQKCFMFFGFNAFWLIFTNLNITFINELFELVFVLSPVAITHLIFKRKISKLLLEYEEILFEVKQLEELKKNFGKEIEQS
ncbi:MFS transporter [Vibrio crassostreae]|nr:MFS transporter [Vibrio crassostreae]